MSYRFISLDLSKANTGFSECLVNETFTSFDFKSKSFFPEYKTYYGNSNAIDNYYLEVNEIMNQLKESLISFKEEKKFAIIENPVFTSFSSELAYYLMQKTLELLCSLEIEAISIVPNTLKKYVGYLYRSKFFKEFPKKKRVYDKLEIGEMYKQLKNINAFAKYNIIEEPTNDDERDSFFLLIYLIENFNKEYLRLFDSCNVKDYESLKYIPINKDSFNSIYIDKAFFTLEDKKFYPFKYLKMINFI